MVRESQRKDRLAEQVGGEGVDHLVARVAGREVLLAEAIPAWAGRLPVSWISSLCADPTDSPRPKGWETTLEPYRTLNLKSKG